MFFLFINETLSQADPATLAQVIPSHIAWVEEMIDRDRIIQAGKWGDIGGMVIFRAESAAQVEDWLAGDPLIASGLTGWRLAEFFPALPID